MELKVMRLCDFPEPDTSYFQPWRLEMLYEIEPGLKKIAENTVAKRGKRYPEKLEAYTQAKHDADKLLGWSARDPRLRSAGAWDCFFRYLLDELNI